ncbi:DNA starvation/stationary phase protection protein [Schaalia cardiffensis]|uniref:Dps family DNA-binding stress response protein n=1 Tax=Schaalia cardiffensis F0333 TaxID=888050 RepID=N6X4C3_9ACTO|nr:DNA starvation/stationary phase protection protein [Schaalia cardiffensis]ENO18232.1 dps family DNA-binding stress response protein [Schaalia cardiffensis F0333]MBJ2329154.1 DNA starvation/stationary phase protection protein [Schaalia cardiffensis]
MSDTPVKNPSVIPVFSATPELSDALERVLVDVTALSLVSKQIHWNVVGPNFRDIHLNLDEVVTIAREASDEIAERMRAINAIPDGRPEAIAERTSVPSAPEGVLMVSDAVDYMVNALNAVVSTLREVHKVVDETDSMSSGIVEDYVLRLEQQAWFLSSQNYSA